MLSHECERHSGLILDSDVRRGGWATSACRRRRRRRRHVDVTLAPVAVEQERVEPVDQCHRQRKELHRRNMHIHWYG